MRKIEKEERERVKKGDMRTLKEILKKDLEESLITLKVCKEDHRYYQGITQVLERYAELL